MFKAEERGREKTKSTAPTSSGRTNPLVDCVAPATLKAHAQFGLLLALQELTQGKRGSKAACHCCPSAISMQSLSRQQQQVPDNKNNEKASKCFKTALQWPKPTVQINHPEMSYHYNKIH
jgi:hypothetical protein